MVTGYAIASGTNDVLLCILVAVLVLLYFVSLWRKPHPNHVFFLSLLERLGEATDSDKGDEQRTGPTEGTPESPGPISAKLDANG